VQSRRNRQAAKRFFRKLLKELRYVPRVLITDKLKNYAAAKVKTMPRVEHRQHKGLNNRAELPTDTATRTTDAPRQVSRSCTAISVRTRPDQQSLPVSAQRLVGGTVSVHPKRHFHFGMRLSVQTILCNRIIFRSASRQFELDFSPSSFLLAKLTMSVALITDDDLSS
jgi:hypothetical protein